MNCEKCKRLKKCPRCKKEREYYICHGLEKGEKCKDFEKKGKKE